MKLAYVARLGLKEFRAIKFINKLTEHYDLVILGGDGTPNPEHLTRDKVLIVSGDEDDILITKKAREYEILMDGRIYDFKGLKIAGIGGLQSHQDIKRILSEDSKIDILVSHYPPYGCLDTVRVGQRDVNIGIMELNDVLSKVSLLVLFTHVEVLGGVYLKGNIIMLGLNGGIGRYIEVTDKEGLNIGFNSLNLFSH